MLQMIYDKECSLYGDFKNNYEEQKFLNAATTVKKLVKILDENKFQSGSSIDFYDYE